MGIVLQILGPLLLSVIIILIVVVSVEREWRIKINFLPRNYSGRVSWRHIGLEEAANRK